MSHRVSPVHTVGDRQMGDQDWPASRKMAFLLSAASGLWGLIIVGVWALF